MDHNIYIYIYIYKKQSKKILGLISQIYYSDHKIGITWLIEKKIMKSIFQEKIISNDEIKKNIKENNVNFSQ